MSVRPRHHRRIGLRLIITLVLIVIFVVALIFLLSQPVSAPGDSDTSGGGEATDAAESTGDVSGQSGAPQTSNVGSILFMSNRDGDFEIYALTLSESNPINLTNNDADDGFGAYSLDRAQISFLSSRDGELGGFLMDADGANQVGATASLATFVSLVTAGRGDWDVRQNAIGTSVLVSLRDLNLEIYARSEAGDVNLSRNGAIDWYPDLSPDGLRVVFASDRVDGQHDIYLVDVDGENLLRLTDDPANEFSPVWTLDGEGVIFAAERDAPFANGQIGLYMIDVGGIDPDALAAGEFPPVTPITSAPPTPADQLYAGVQTNGMARVYMSNREGNWEIYMTDAVGRHEINLTNNPYDDLFPVWMP